MAKHSWEEELAVELKVELAAAASYQERTGKNFYTLDLVRQRKEIENWREDHDFSV